MQESSSLDTERLMWSHMRFYSESLCLSHPNWSTSESSSKLTEEMMTLQLSMLACILGFMRFQVAYYPIIHVSYTFSRKLLWWHRPKENPNLYWLNKQKWSECVLEVIGLNQRLTSIWQMIGSVTLQLSVNHHLDWFLNLWTLLMIFKELSLRWKFAKCQRSAKC